MNSIKLRQIRKIIKPPATHWVGNGFKVSSFLSPDQTWFSPFALLDYNAKMTVPPSQTPRGVGSHPHRGLETVTLAYSGSIEHHDSYGGGGTIGTGQVQWMTAGSGLLHKEFYEKKFNTTGGDFQMVQLWTNLPAKDKMTKPRYQELKDFAKYEFDGGYLEVVAGGFGDTKGSAKTFSPINLYNLSLYKQANFNFELPENHNSGLLILEGRATVNNQKIDTNSLVFFGLGDGKIEVMADDKCLILVLSGEPIDEPVASYGPFLMNTKEELVQAFEDFNSGKFGELSDL